MVCAGCSPEGGEQQEQQGPFLVIDSGGHTSRINTVIFTRDGRFLISGGDDKVVRVWAVASGQVVRTIRGEIGEGDEGKIFAMALSPDERLLAVGGWLAGTPVQIASIRLHDFQTGEVLGRLEGHTNVIQALAFSPDGRTLASGSSDNTVWLWDVAARREAQVLRGHTDEVYAVAFSPDGKRLASGSYDKTLGLWDVATGTRNGELRAHVAEVFAVAFSPDERFLASGSKDRTIRLWNPRTGAPLKVMAHQESTVHSLSFSPDGGRLLTGTGSGGRKVSHVFAVPTGEDLSKLEHDNVVFATAFSPDGRLVATAGGSAHEIQLWQPADGKAIRRLVGAGRPVWSVAFGRDGETLAFGQTYTPLHFNHLGPLERSLELERAGRFDLRFGNTAPAEASFERVRSRSEQYRLETPSGGDNSVLQIVRNGKTLHELRRDITSGSRHFSFTLSRAGRFVVSGGDHGALTVYSTATGATHRELVGHTGDVWTVAISPDDRLVASGSLDQTLRLWDLASGRLLVSVFAGTDGEWVAWTPRGYYTASAQGDRYLGWQVNRGVDRQAEYYPLQQFQGQYHRPDVVAATLELRDHDLALAEADRRRPVAPAAPVEPPPEVVVVEPRPDELRRTSSKLRVKAIAVSRGSAVTELTISLNGRVIDRVEGVAEGNPLQREAAAEVDLVPGTNVLTFVAATQSSRSQPAEVRVDYVAAGEVHSRAALPTLAVFAVGISDYSALGFQLNYADDDARAIAQVFAGQQGKAFGRVATRVLDGSRPVTRAEILAGLDWLKAEAPGKESVRLLFLSGHGELGTRGEYYFLSQDHEPGSNLEMQNLSWRALLALLTEGEATAVLMADTCHAASAGPDHRANANLTEALLQVTPQNLVAFTASSDWLVSVERPEWQHGVFTQALLLGLRDGLADGEGGPKDGHVEAGELGSWVVKWVREQTNGAQRPIYSPAPGLDALVLHQLR